MSATTIRIIVNGASGKMGAETVKAVSAQSDMELVAQLDQVDNLDQALTKYEPDIVIDFTQPSSVFENSKTIISRGVRPVIGTTGLALDEIEYLQSMARDAQIGGLIAPNFSIGAILMMKFSEMAAAYFPAAEIIELHHDHKKDAPSGTAIKTAQMIASARKEIPHDPTETETLKGARGGKCQDVPIHSVRLPGFVASQKVIFGGASETLTISHDSIHRECFMPGIIMACKKVMDLKQLVYGLENLLA